MRAIFKALALAMVLLGSLAIMPEIREARAQTTYTAQKVGWGSYYLYTLNESSTGTGTAGQNIQTVYWDSQEVSLFTGQYIKLIGLNLKKQGSPPNPLTVELRTDSSDSPSSTILGSGTISAASLTTSYVWYNITLSVIKLTSSAMYHIVCHTTGGDGSNYYGWNAGADSSYKSTSYEGENSANSGTSWADQAYDYTFKVYPSPLSSGYTTTTSSQFWSSGSSKQYRFDFSYSFAGGSTDRSLNCTYPRDSYRINVTTNAGTLITASSYTDSLLNGTHRTVSIPEAVIASYGSSYYLYSHEFNHVYWLTGQDYDNGTYRGSVSLTMANTTGSYTETLNHILVVGTSSIPDSFCWPIGSFTRYIAPLEDFENFTITYPDGTGEAYSFMIRDFIGIIPGEDCYLESFRMMSGIQTLIERQLIKDTINGVPLSLTQNRVYIIEIYDTTNEVGHEFGYFMPTAYNTEPYLTLSTLAFTDQAQMVSQWVRTEAQREDPYTSIIVIYNNTLSSSYNADANLKVKKRDGTLIYDSTTTDDYHLWTVPGLTNTTDYIIYLTVTHEFWGTLKWTKILSGAHSFLAPPDLGILGTWGGIPSGNVLSATLILMVAGLFSFLSAGVGIFIVVVLSAGLLRLGWISTPSSGIIIVTLGLAILLALSLRLKR